MATDPPLYWDSSALVSVFETDDHSVMARRRRSEPRTHIVSTLAFAEVCAALARMQRALADGRHLVFAAAAHLRSGLWTPMALPPRTDVIEELAERWPLRGADLWHLSTAVTLYRDGGAIELLTFDDALREAAVGEGLAA